MTAGTWQAERSLFDIPDEVVYLNTANFAPRLRAVTRAGEEAVARLAAPWTIRPEEFFEGAERLRALFAALVGADRECVALVPAVSYGIAVAARNVRVEAGESVVVLDEQFPSNVYAWRRLCAERGARLRIAGRDPERGLTEAVLELADEQTAVIAVPHCHWTDGALLDLERIGAAARQAGAALVVDASQSLGAVPFDVKSVRPDFLVSVGYKWQLGPYGVAYMYVDPKWHEEGTPLEESWLTREGSEDFAGLVDYVDRYRPGARRFDGGQFPRFLTMPMAEGALTQLRDWGVERIYGQLGEVTAAIESATGVLGLEPTQPFERARHMLGIALPKGVAAGVGEGLRRRNIHLSVRGDALRIAPHLHTTESDVEALLEGLAACVGESAG